MNYQNNSGTQQPNTDANNQQATGPQVKGVVPPSRTKWFSIGAIVGSAATCGVAFFLGRKAGVDAVVAASTTEV